MLHSLVTKRHRAHATQQQARDRMADTVCGLAAIIRISDACLTNYNKLHVITQFCCGHTHFMR